MYIYSIIHHAVRRAYKLLQDDGEAGTPTERRRKFRKVQKFSHCRNRDSQR